MREKARRRSLIVSISLLHRPCVPPASPMLAAEAAARACPLVAVVSHTASGLSRGFHASLSVVPKTRGWLSAVPSVVGPLHPSA